VPKKDLKDLWDLKEVSSKSQGRMSLQMWFEWAVNQRIRLFSISPSGVWLVLLTATAVTVQVLVASTEQLGCLR
jgi:hypothetical protein